MSQRRSSRQPPERRWPRLRLKRLSFSQGTEWPRDNEEVFVDCPPFLDGDETAYATYVPASKDYNFLLRPGSLMYVTRRRDPVANDVVILHLKDGRDIVRFLAEVLETGYRLINVNDQCCLDSEEIPFEDLSEVGVLAGTCRI